jgi:hypothetical protein
LDIWIALKSSAYSLEGNYLPQIKFPGKIEITNKFKDPTFDQEEIAKKLKKWGAKYFMIGSGSGIHLDARFFNEMKHGQNFGIYENVYKNSPEIVRTMSGKNSAEFEAFSEEESVITIPVNYHPNWVIKINGEIERFKADAENLIEVKIKKGKNFIQMAFSIGAVEILALIESLIALSVALFTAINQKKREALWQFISSAPTL